MPKFLFHTAVAVGLLEGVACPTNGSLRSNQALPARASLLPNKNSQILHPKLQEESVVISLLFAVSSASAKVKLRKRKSTTKLISFVVFIYTTPKVPPTASQ